MEDGLSYKVVEHLLCQQVQVLRTVDGDAEETLVL